MAEVAFGIFDWVDRGQRPLSQLYEERLQLLEAADRAGFYSYHLAEHHATPLGMAPSPALFLTAVAQRTRNIRLGPLGYLLPLYHPLRLIEEVCMLDQLSGGRLDLGVGRGISPYEVRNFGVDPAQSRSLFHEAMSVLVAGLTRDTLDFQGEHYRFTDVPMELAPQQRPYPPLWYPTRNPESVAYAGRHGYHLVSLGPAEGIRQHVTAYWDAWQAHRSDPDRLNGHVASPRVGVMRQALVADTDQEAETVARAAHRDWFDSITRLWHTHGDHSLDGQFSWEASMQQESVIFGSPERVREQVGRLLEVSGCNYIICAFAWGTLTLEQSLRSLELFAGEVMPALAGRPVPAP